MLTRNPVQAAEATYDVIVTGGGIYGVAVLLEAARRGLRSVLLERDDYGGNTTWNSFRILHGGLRYLQKLDFPRHRESAFEQTWFVRNFPELVEPLRCVFPLYGRGLHRESLFRLAFVVDEALGRDRPVRGGRPRNGGITRFVTGDEIISLFPFIERKGLISGAQWHEAAMPQSQLLVIEMLRWAIAFGAASANYVEVLGLLRERDRVVGVRAYDHVAGRLLRFHAPIVVNCAGPSCGTVACGFDREIDALFQPSLAFNLVLNREFPSGLALAVPPRSGVGSTYFLHSLHGFMFAGTFHCAVSLENPATHLPTEEQIELFVQTINSALPELHLNSCEVLRVHSGLLPVTRAGTVRLSARPIVRNHAKCGGPEGLFSVSGVKFTTARRVAEKVVHAICKLSQLRCTEQSVPRPEPVEIPRPQCLASSLARNDKNATHDLLRLIDDLAVVTEEDFLLRRADWGLGGCYLPTIRAALTDLCNRRTPQRPTCSML